MDIDEKEFFSIREHYTVPCLFYGSDRQFTIEDLYLAFKKRLLREMTILPKEKVKRG